MRSSLLAVVVLVAVVGCSGTEGPAGPKGDTGAKGDPGPKGDTGASVAVNILAAGSTDCPTGGIEVVAPEGRRVVCNGAKGADGMNGMNGSDGMNGMNGANGTDGTNGMNGMNGADGTSVTLAAELAGSNCTTGGARLTAGTTTTYVCNGADGTNGATSGLLPDGGTAPGAVLTATAAGGVEVNTAGLLSSGSLKFPNRTAMTIGMDSVVGGGTNLTISAGGSTSNPASAAGGGLLELRAGSANVSGAASCSTCNPAVAGACPGPSNNSLRLYAGDNVLSTSFVCNQWVNGDIEFYAGNNLPMRMVVNGNSGNVGIGVAFPTQRLEVAGNVLATNVTVPSDARLKQDIKQIDRAADLVKQLRGVRYKWTPAARARFGSDDKQTMGLLAQDVQRVMPEAVTVLPDGTLTVSYDKVVPVLVEAMKSQQSRIDQLEASERRLKALESRLEKLERQ